MNNKIDKKLEKCCAPVKSVDISFGGRQHSVIPTHTLLPPPPPEDNTVQQTNEWSEAADERWVY